MRDVGFSRFCERGGGWGSQRACRGASSMAQSLPAVPSGFAPILAGVILALGLGSLASPAAETEVKLSSGTGAKSRRACRPPTINRHRSDPRVPRPDRHSDPAALGCERSGRRHGLLAYPSPAGIRCRGGPAARDSRKPKLRLAATRVPPRGPTGSIADAAAAPQHRAVRGEGRAVARR